MDKTLKVGVIGCGRISVMHFGSIEHFDDAKLVACCDIVKERADEYAEKYGCKSYRDYKEMLQKEELDLVHLCLPHYLHSEVAIYAMEHGVNVLTEKPMDINYERAEKAVEVAKKTGLKFGVIFQCRYNNATKFVKKALTDGKLGKIISARSILTWKRTEEYYAESDWKGTWDKEGGGVLIDQAIHSFDLTNWMINSDIEDIKCAMFNYTHPFLKVEDTVNALITYKNGVKYALYCMNNYGCDEPIEVRLLCEKGKVIFTYDDAYITYNDGVKEEAHQRDEDLAVDGGKDYWGFQHANQIRQYYNAVKGLEPLEISGEEALKTHKVICKLYDIGKRTLNQ